MIGYLKHFAAMMSSTGWMPWLNSSLPKEWAGGVLVQLFGERWEWYIGMSPMTVSFSRRFFVQAFSLGLFVSAYVSPYKYDFHEHGIEDIKNHITITDKTSLKKSKWRTVYDSFL